MDYDYLFYEDLPKGVKSVYVNGKRMSLKEFNQHKKNYLSKKGQKKLSLRELLEIVFVVLFIILVYFFLKK